jgi:hypothetical protein
MATDPITLHPANESAQQEASESRASPLSLPAPEEGSVDYLDVQSGETKSMSSSMGPLIVREDGLLERIANWSKMTEHEQQVAMRRITKRNRQRLASLRNCSNKPNENGDKESNANA